MIPTAGRPEHGADRNICAPGSVAPAESTQRYAAKAPRGERLYNEGRFDLYVGAAFEKVVADQLAFLQAHVPPAPSFIAPHSASAGTHGRSLRPPDAGERIFSASYGRLALPAGRAAPGTRGNELDVRHGKAGTSRRHARPKTLRRAAVSIWKHEAGSAHELRRSERAPRA
jgi:hypothetical protein